MRHEGTLPCCELRYAKENINSHFKNGELITNSVDKLVGDVPRQDSVRSLCLVEVIRRVL